MSAICSRLVVCAIKPRSAIDQFEVTCVFGVKPEHLRFLSIVLVDSFKKRAIKKNKRAFSMLLLLEAA
jgi:hypothetical protein